jgi:hypothetical protein
MISSKLRSMLGMSFAVVIGVAFHTSPGFAQDQQQAPPQSDQAAPTANPDSNGQMGEPGAGSGADTGNSDTLPAAGGSQEPSPAAEPSQDGAAAAPGTEPSAEPSRDSGASTTEAPPAPANGDTGDAAAPPAGSADVPPVQPEPPAATTEPATPSPSGSPAAAAVNANQLQIGAAVFGADGAKIGEINGVKSDDTGKVQEILVTDGVAAGINAKAFAISADKITSVSDGVKLSLSSEEAKKLPIIDNGNG